MTSKTRRIIEKWVKGALRNPTYLASGEVFIAPSKSGNANHYLVARLVRYTPKRSYVEWVCSCKGFWYSETDECVHVKGLRQAWEAKANGAKIDSIRAS